jgi:uncharacterized membrane protein (UPF0127 family)
MLAVLDLGDFMMQLRRLGLILALLVLAVANSAAGAELPVTTLTISGHKVVAEVVVTPEQRAQGLMNRFSLQPDHGMLFVFEQPQPLGFWMKNTYIPLSIAFIDADGRIVNIDDMKPLDESTHRSKGISLYALEMKQGWFAAKGIATGDVVKGLPAAAAR